MSDQWSLLLAGAVTALITYALPKLIEGVFRSRVTESEAEAAQETIEAARWKKAQDDIEEFTEENKRLRRLLRKYGIDPNESGPLTDRKNE